MNSRCQTGFTTKGYRCVCADGFSGHNCSEGTFVITKKTNKAHEFLGG